jgi:hypothetical protein
MQTLILLLAGTGVATLLILAIKGLLALRRDYRVCVHSRDGVRLCTHTFPRKRAAIEFACTQPSASVHRRYVGGRTIWLHSHHVEYPAED